MVIQKYLFIDVLNKKKIALVINYEVHCIIDINSYSKNGNE